MDLKFIYKYVNIFDNIIQIYLLNGDESEQNLLSVVRFYHQFIRSNIRDVFFMVGSVTNMTVDHSLALVHFLHIFLMDYILDKINNLFLGN